MHYARLHEETAENPEIGTLLEENPLAASLFMLGLARCDLYGILPGDPQRYHTKVAPAAVLPPATVADAIKAQEEHGLIRRFTDLDGKEHLHILAYHRWQEVRWANGVAPPQVDMPDWWEPPEGFMVWIQSDKCLRWARQQERWWEIRERYCSATVVLRLRSRYTTLNKKQETRNKKQNDSNGLTANDSTSKASTMAAGTLNLFASLDDQNDPEQHLPDKPKGRTRTKTDRDLCFEGCLSAFGIAPDDLDKPQWARYAKTMNKLVADTCLEDLQEFVRRNPGGSASLGTGANPARKVPAAVRRAVTATSWQEAFGRARQQQVLDALPTPGGNGEQEPIEIRFPRFVWKQYGQEGEPALEVRSACAEFVECHGADATQAFGRFLETQDCQVPASASPEKHIAMRIRRWKSYSGEWDGKHN